MSTNVLAPERHLALWGFGLNLAWELGQTPLYADSGRGLLYLAWTRVHCTLGDVLILLGAFWLTAVFFRSRHWYLASTVLGPTIFSGTGLAYTMWSEWLNTSIRSTWEYRPEMPVLLGIGLAPLLQWILLPPLLVTLLRRRTAASGPSAEGESPWPRRTRS